MSSGILEAGNAYVACFTDPLIQSLDERVPLEPQFLAFRKCFYQWTCIFGNSKPTKRGSIKEVDDDVTYMVGYLIELIVALHITRHGTKCM